VETVEVVEADTDLVKQRNDRILYDFYEKKDVQSVVGEGFEKAGRGLDITNQSQDS